jgi:primosomal protein N'
VVAGVVVGAIQELDLQIPCRWCGMVTPVGVTCESCGSPMEALVRCRYCTKQSLEPVCPSCREVLIRLWRIAQESPDSRFLFADVL